MVRLIMGVKGSGKTKQLIELINNAAKDEPGNVVCIEANRNMTYDIHYHIRLIDAEEYKLNSYEMFRGFISGLYAGNYDISHVFIDNLCKTVGREVDKDTEHVPGLAGCVRREEQHQVHRHHQRRSGPGHRRHEEVPVRSSSTVKKRKGIALPLFLINQAHFTLSAGRSCHSSRAG